MKTLEQRLKDQLGELLFTVNVLQTEHEKALEKLAKYEKPEDKEESNVTELKVK